MGEIEPNDIVNSALEMNSDAIHNAIISLMFTTGLDKRNIRNITINELLKAAAMCFKEDESHNIEILTNKNDGLLKMTQNTKLYSAAQTPQDILSNILNIMGNIMISMILMNYSE